MLNKDIINNENIKTKAYCKFLGLILVKDLYIVLTSKKA